MCLILLLYIVNGTGHNWQIFPPSTFSLSIFPGVLAKKKYKFCTLGLLKELKTKCLVLVLTFKYTL